MHHVFASHQELGRICDEPIYRNDLAARINEESSQTTLNEVVIKIIHGSFFKEYRMDLTVSSRAVYELKVAKIIAPQHEGQTLNYLLLADCAHGKVINFGGAT